MIRNDLVELYNVQRLSLDLHGPDDLLLWVGVAVQDVGDLVPAGLDGGADPLHLLQGALVRRRGRHKVLLPSVRCEQCDPSHYDLVMHCYLIRKPPEDCGEIFMVILICSVFLAIGHNLFIFTNEIGDRWKHYHTHLSQSLEHDVTQSDSPLSNPLLTQPSYRCVPQTTQSYSRAGQPVLTDLTQCSAAGGQPVSWPGSQLLTTILMAFFLRPVMSGLSSHDHHHYHYDNDFSEINTRYQD